MGPYEKALKTRLTRTEDRRIKLSDDERKQIVLRHNGGEGVRSIARAFPQVSRRTVQFILFPERAQHNAKLYKIRGQAKKSYDKVRGEKWAARMKEHRAYKQEAIRKRGQGESYTQEQ